MSKVSPQKNTLMCVPAFRHLMKYKVHFKQIWKKIIYRGTTMISLYDTVTIICQDAFKYRYIQSEMLIICGKVTLIRVFGLKSCQFADVKATHIYFSFHRPTAPTGKQPAEEINYT